MDNATTRREKVRAALKAMGLRLRIEDQRKLRDMVAEVIKRGPVPPRARR